MAVTSWPLIHQLSMLPGVENCIQWSAQNMGETIRQKNLYTEYFQKQWGRLSHDAGYHYRDTGNDKSQK
jgi:hypothetical protein